jgi:hypothetical protein
LEYLKLCAIVSGTEEKQLLRTSWRSLSRQQVHPFSSTSFVSDQKLFEYEELNTESTILGLEETAVTCHVKVFEQTHEPCQAGH